MLYAASSLAAAGFVPDVVFAHPGWGETLPLRSAFPKARHITYCELFYRVDGEDAGFDPEFPGITIDGDVGIRAKNAATLLALVDCDAAVSPTAWQRSTFPDEFRSKIQVIHDGIDVTHAKPSAHASFQLPDGRTLSKADGSSHVCRPKLRTRTGISHLRQGFTADTRFASQRANSLNRW